MQSVCEPEPVSSQEPLLRDQRALRGNIFERLHRVMGHDLVRGVIRDEAHHASQSCGRHVPGVRVSFDGRGWFAVDGLLRALVSISVWLRRDVEQQLAQRRARFPLHGDVVPRIF